MRGFAANQAIEGSAEQHRCSVPSSLRSSAPPHRRRWAFRVSGETSCASGMGTGCGAGREIAVLVASAVVQWHSTGLEAETPHRRGIKPSALRLATVEASMSRTVVGASDVASDHAAPRCAPLRSASGHRYALCVGQCRRLVRWGA
jgi:hypothetical protein